MKRILAIITAICMALTMACGTSVFADADQYTATFDLPDGVTIDVFYTQDYTTPSATNVTAAAARASKTGEIDVSGSGQINFRVNLPEGYTLDTDNTEITGTYNKFSGPSDTGADNVYKITKVQSDLTVKIAIKSSRTEAYTATFDVPDGITVDVFKTSDYTEDVLETSATTAIARDDEGDPSLDDEGQVNFRINGIPEGYSASVTATDGKYKNIKGPSETEAANIYRVTKISGDLTITVTLTQDPYTATFDLSGAEGASVNVYHTQSYSQADETNVKEAVARDSESGEVDNSGEGQINFRILVEDGYVLTGVTASPSNFKNFKTPADLVEDFEEKAMSTENVDFANLYRITKIRGDFTVKITTAKESEITPFTATFDKTNAEGVTVDFFNKQSYSTPTASDVSSAVATNEFSGATDISGEGQVNFRVNVAEGYGLDSVAAEGEGTSYNQLKTPADTMEDGVFRLTKVKGNVTVVIKSHKHDYVSKHVDPQIGIAGKDYQQCSVCDEIINETVIDPLTPATTTISKLTKYRKAIKVTWKKKSYTGYQIRYCLKSSMDSAKTTSVSKASTTSKKITGLKAKKKYYVQIRTYKTVNGTKVYSDWSKKRAITTR